MMLSNDQIRELTDQAMQAFWQVIAERFVRATTGDLSIDRSIRFSLAAEEAVREWIKNNVVRVDSDEEQSVSRIHVRPGYRFMLRRDVDRFPDFLVPKGSTGTVISAQKGSVVALMDDVIQGAQEWENHVIWERDFLDDTAPLES